MDFSILGGLGGLFINPHVLFEWANFDLVKALDIS